MGIGIGGRSIGGGLFSLLISFDEELLGAAPLEDEDFEDFEPFAEEAGGMCRNGAKYAPLG